MCLKKQRVSWWLLGIWVLSMVFCACSKKKDTAGEDSENSLHDTEPTTTVDSDSTNETPTDSDLTVSTDAPTGTDSGEDTMNTDSDSATEVVDSARQLTGRLVPGSGISSSGNKVLRGAVEPVYQGKTSTAANKQLIHLGITVKKD
ncbi:MAG: hypothetical protein JXX29_17640 [Deltaproteobacteria bacterium]|nr:hypothetical protein [Deltaproteobacteria bacterium]MBN2673508.1 hypothetical protein [Deltaproteobacteria bacterium]